MFSVCVDDTGRSTLPTCALHPSLLIFFLPFSIGILLIPFLYVFFCSFLLYIRAGEIFSARCTLHQKLQIQSAVSRFYCALMPTDDFNEIFSSVLSFVLQFFNSSVGAGEAKSV
jgi:hypothetical protein